jgi:hypothetical protein
MIGHEAVRTDCKRFLGGTAQKLRDDELDGRLVGEESEAVMCAKCQEIPVTTDVIEGG